MFLESDEVAKATTKKNDKINAVIETIDCKVCLKKHKNVNARINVVIVIWWAATSKRIVSRNTQSWREVEVIRETNMEDQNPGPNLEEDLEYGDSRKDDRLNRVVD